MAEDDEAFLEALREDREGSDTREVYADRLEEEGQLERAEYLRVEATVRSFDFITGNPERERLRKRRDELEDQLGKSDRAWLAAVSRAARPRAPRPRAPRPRPTRVGVAEPISAKAEVPTPDPSSDLASMQNPLDRMQLPPPPEVAPRGQWLSVVGWIVVGIAVMLLVQDVRTKGFLQAGYDLLRSIYESNGKQLP